MPSIEPQPPRDVAALLVRGSDVPRDVLDELSIQMELLLEELGREGPALDEPLDWKSVDPTFPGHRILVAPDRSVADATGAVSGLLSHAVRGVALLETRARRPPGFTMAALGHLERIARALERPGVSGLSFYANRRSEAITERTLGHLRALTEGS